MAIPDYRYLSFPKFNDLLLSEDDTVLGSVKIFIDSGLVEAFRLNTKVSFSLLWDEWGGWNRPCS